MQKKNMQNAEREDAEQWFHQYAGFTKLLEGNKDCRVASSYSKYTQQQMVLRTPRKIFSKALLLLAC